MYRIKLYGRTRRFLVGNSIKDIKRQIGKDANWKHIIIEEMGSNFIPKHSVKLKGL